MEQQKSNINIAVVLLILLLLVFFVIQISKPQKEEVSYNEDFSNKIENGIHVRTGLKDGTGLMAVVNNCTNCHSAKLIIQNSMDAHSWNATIKWMQQTQNLWELGGDQEVIVNYLVTNYPVKKTARRAGLLVSNWYEIK
jgi:preprotein translocase subunit YajC